MEERTERESDRRREVADLLVLPRPAKSLQKTLNILGLLKSATERAVGKYARAALPKKKRNRASLKRKIVRWERVKASEKRTLAEKREIRAGRWRGNGRLYREEMGVPRRTGGQARRASLGEVEGSMSR